MDRQKITATAFTLLFTLSFFSTKAQSNKDIEETGKIKNVIIEYFKHVKSVAGLPSKFNNTASENFCTQMWERDQPNWHGYADPYYYKNIERHVVYAHGKTKANIGQWTVVENSGHLKQKIANANTENLYNAFSYFAINNNNAFYRSLVHDGRFLPNAIIAITRTINTATYVVNIANTVGQLYADPNPITIINSVTIKNDVESIVKTFQAGTSAKGHDDAPDGDIAKRVADNAGRSLNKLRAMNFSPNSQEYKIQQILERCFTSLSKLKIPNGSDYLTPQWQIEYYYIFDVTIAELNRV